MERCLNEEGFEVSLGRRIREIREARGFKQKDFALEADLSQSAVAQIEQGRKTPSLGTVRRIAGVLNVDVAVLFATDRVHVFNLEKLRVEVSSAEHLTPAVYKSLGLVVQYAKDISFFGGSWVASTASPNKSGTYRTQSLRNGSSTEKTTY